MQGKAKRQCVKGFCDELTALAIPSESKFLIFDSEMIFLTYLLNTIIAPGNISKENCLKKSFVKIT
jgi:hypothetical protein